MFKKLLTTFICFNIIISPGFCAINDDFVEKTLSTNQKIKAIEDPIYKDTFAEQTINKNLKPKKIKTVVITDTFAENNKNKNNHIKPKVEFNEQIITVSSKQSIATKAPIYITEEKSTPIKIRIKNYFTTKQKKFDEGDFIEFETIAETKIKDKTYPAGTTVKARIETISYNKSKGVPSDVVVGNFSIDNIPLKGEISKTGANRSLWIYPVSCISSLFFGVGVLLLPIRGGHAKIRQRQIFTVYY